MCGECGLSLPLPLYGTLGIVSSAAGIRLPVRLRKRLCMEWQSPGTGALCAPVEEKALL